MALFARADGAEVHLLGTDARSLAFARSLGVAGVWTREELPDLAFDAVVDASGAPELPALAVDLVEPGRRVVYIGISRGARAASTPAHSCSRTSPASVILSASPGLAETVARYADGAVDPRPLVAATVALEDVAGVLAGAPAGRRRAGAEDPRGPAGLTKAPRSTAGRGSAGALLSVVCRWST